MLLQPNKQTTDAWISHWLGRHFLLVVVPCIVVWAWVAVPFPSRLSKDPQSGTPDNASDDAWIQPSFAFFLFYYYGIFLAVALLFITKLFDLYRLNWWPRSMSGPTCYTMFWLSSLTVGWVCHELDILGIGDRLRGHKRHRAEDQVDWERKSRCVCVCASPKRTRTLNETIYFAAFWIALAFLTMLMPAVVCFRKLKRDKMHKYRRDLTELENT